MSITFWLPLFFASPPAPAACTEAGVPLLEMRQRSTADARMTTTKIFASGAWTVEGMGVADRGCLERDEIKAIRSAVQRAPWQTVTSPVRCFAYDPKFTEYVVHGKLRFTEQFCSGKAADFQTAQAIDLVKAELVEEAAEAPPAKPGVCRVAGTPLFEIKKRSDFAEATSTIAIYSTGAWTYQPIDKAGHAGALTTGCFDQATRASLRDAIDHSPWDTTFSRIVCKAYSPRFTQYYVHGKLEYTARLCGAERLDDKSRGAIEIVERELAKVLPGK